MFQLLKHLKNYFLNSYQNFFLWPTLISHAQKTDLRHNRNRSSYNQQSEVKAKKKALYLANKEKYYLAKKRKRDLDRKLRQKA